MANFVHLELRTVNNSSLTKNPNKIIESPLALHKQAFIAKNPVSIQTYLTMIFPENSHYISLPSSE